MHTRTRMHVRAHIRAHNARERTRTRPRTYFLSTYPPCPYLSLPPPPFRGEGGEGELRARVSRKELLNGAEWHRQVPFSAV